MLTVCQRCTATNISDTLSLARACVGLRHVWIEAWSALSPPQENTDVREKNNRDGGGELHSRQALSAAKYLPFYMNAIS